MLFVLESATDCVYSRGIFADQNAVYKHYDSQDNYTKVVTNRKLYILRLVSNAYAQISHHRGTKSILDGSPSSL